MLSLFQIFSNHIASWETPHLLFIVETPHFLSLLMCIFMKIVIESVLSSFFFHTSPSLTVTLSTAKVLKSRNSRTATINKSMLHFSITVHDVSGRAVLRHPKKHTNIWAVNLQKENFLQPLEVKEYTLYYLTNHSSSYKNKKFNLSCKKAWPSWYPYSFVGLKFSGLLQSISQFRSLISEPGFY